MFKLHKSFQPTGDQPEAIKKLTKNLKNNIPYQVLLGVTGSGKTFTMANVIEQTQKPTLVISHNKTLAAQLYQEFKEFFPNNAVHYFVSYYDYYQPEVYMPAKDIYIEKEADVNQEIDRLRHAAVQDLLSRKDVIVVASVSCIYNIGSPENYQSISLDISKDQNLSRKEFIFQLISLQYKRDDFDFEPGNFRVRGNIIEIFLVTGEKIIKVEFDKKKIEKISESDSRDIFNLKFKNQESIKIFPAKFWMGPEEKLNIAIGNIRLEMQKHVETFKRENKLLEAQRIEQRTNHDLEFLRETGFCNGIENYSRHLEFRDPKSSPFVLLDYFPKGFLTIIDESHMTIPQLKAMSAQDKARKDTLIEYGFRLPSAIDNRPLRYEEFEEKTNQIIYSSATPSVFEKEKAGKNIVEQLIRPTGLLEPSIEIRPTDNQVEDLIEEIKKRKEKGQRVLAITLTKKLSEALADYLLRQDIKTQWLHSEIKTLDRPKILRDLRLGEYDVLVGINLLREGLDLPEVSLIAILDADKEGFLRSETTLIQTMGRAARHIDGHVILYANKMTGSMERAIKETERRKKIQIAYNKKNNIVPSAIKSKIKEWNLANAPKEVDLFGISRDIKNLEKEIKKSVKNLEFEKAAKIRDMIKKIK
ncbi:MAG: excinuclease ABC subunit UvrB [Patescibacteria group bacterium]